MSKSSSGKKRAKESSRFQEQLARELDQTIAPVRQNLVGQANQFLQTGDVTGLPQFAGVKSIAEEQFGRARDAVIAGTPEGGGLTSALAQLESDRANSLAQLVGQLGGQTIDRAQNLVLGQTGQVTGSAATASALAQQAAQIEAQQNAQKATNLGRVVGAVATKGASASVGGGAGGSAGAGKGP